MSRRECEKYAPQFLEFLCSCPAFAVEIMIINVFFLKRNCDIDISNYINAFKRGLLCPFHNPILELKWTGQCCRATKHERKSSSRSCHCVRVEVGFVCVLC